MEEKLIVPISAIEHYSYCPRQCGLIHLEQIFEENVYTIRGRMVHETVDSAASETHGSVVIERSVRLWSERLGLAGKADVIEFKDGIPYPVEYKSGAIGPWQHAALQVCAQGMCLEEMLEMELKEGAIYYYRSRRRKQVIFTPLLREKVKRIVEEIRRMLTDNLLPSPAPGARCHNCSLVEVCMPWAEENIKRRVRDLFLLEED